MERATVNGVELEYEVQGTGEPLLLIHGALIAGAFKPLLGQPSLADHCQLIRYHRRGYAGSTHSASPVSVQDQATDAIGLLDHLGVDRAHVAGHSYGGAIALQMAVDRPELVHTLALLEPALLMVPSGEAFFEAVGPSLEAHASGDRAKAVESFLTLVSGLDWDGFQQIVGPGDLPQAVDDADTFFAIELPALGEWAFGPDQAAAIDQPVLSVVGTDSLALFEEVRTLLHTWFPQTEDFALQGAGHMLQVQQPEAMARGLAEFIASHALSRVAAGRQG